MWGMEKVVTGNGRKNSNSSGIRVIWRIVGRVIGKVTATGRIPGRMVRIRQKFRHRVIRDRTADINIILIQEMEHRITHNGGMVVICSRTMLTGITAANGLTTLSGIIMFPIIMPRVTMIPGIISRMPRVFRIIIPKAAIMSGLTIILRGMINIRWMTTMGKLYRRQGMKMYLKYQEKLYRH